MKKLIIEAPSGLDPKYKLWAREAAGAVSYTHLTQPTT